MSAPLDRLADHPHAARWLDAADFGDRTTVECAVSGGPDSTALLLLARLRGLPATAVHVDHGLRSDSADDARFVADLAASVGAAFVGHVVEVGDGPDLEARARSARRAVLPADAVYGHTMDDQAETVLLALLRGSGLDGLGGMTAAHHPLLALRRADTEAIVAAAGVVPRTDPTNRSPRFRRNRVRHEVFPLLDDVARRDVRALIARQAAHLRDDADLLDDLAAGLDPTDAPALRSVPRPLARRALRRWVRAETDGYPPDADALERMLHVVDGGSTATEIAGGFRVWRSQNRLAIGPIDADPPST